MQIGMIAMSTAIVNLVGDLSILFLTQKVIWNLMRVERRQRLKLSVVFFAGIMYVTFPSHLPHQADQFRSPCVFAIMCLYYNDHQMNSTDFTRDSMYMTIACYGEIASGMFVLFLPVVPKFFAHLKSSPSFTLLSNKRSQRGTVISSVQGDATPGERKKSLFHISYTQKESEEKLQINVVNTVSVRSEVADHFGNDIDIELGQPRGVHMV